MRERKLAYLCVPGGALTGVASTSSGRRGSPENRASEQGLLIVLGVAQLEEGGMMASLLSIPLQLLPPVLLAVNNRAAVRAVCGGWDALEGPSSPHPDGLELGSEHLDLAYLMKLGELMQVYVLQVWKFQFMSWMASR